MNKSYRELRKRQITQGIISILGIIGWGVIVSQSGGLLDDYLILGIAIMAGLSIIAIVQTRKAILCNECNSELTEVYMKADVINKKVKVCPFCGTSVD